MGSSVSRKGVKFISRFEGFSSCPYQDTTSTWTIGYGTTSADRPVGPATPCISESKARRWLRDSLNGQYLRPIRELSLKLRQCEVDALASAVYNLGPGLLTDTANSTIARRLRSAEARTYDGRKLIFHQELPKWNRAGGQALAGLTARRRAEVRLANRGDYSGKP